MSKTHFAENGKVFTLTWLEPRLHVYDHCARQLAATWPFHKLHQTMRRWNLQMSWNAYVYRFTRLCNYAAYTPACLKLIVFQHTCKLPRTLHYTIFMWLSGPQTGLWHGICFCIPPWVWVWVPSCIPNSWFWAHEFGYDFHFAFQIPDFRPMSLGMTSILHSKFSIQRKQTARWNSWWNSCPKSD